MKNETKKTRVWSPKLRAVTFADKRTKREKTRNDVKRKVFKEYL